MVVDEVVRDVIEGERIAQLLRDPSRAWCSCRVGMDDSPPCVIDHDEDVQDVERDRGNGEEVHGGNALPVVLQEGLPAAELIRLRGTPRHVARDCSLGHVESQLLEFAMDPRSAPTIIGGHPPDQLPDFAIDSSTAWRATSRFPGPEETEAPPMPTDDRVRLYDDQGITPARPHAMKEDQKKGGRHGRATGAVASA